jgi:hypothetical protein
VSTAAATTPITIDEPALVRLARGGYRWTEGQAGLVRYRWLMPPGWVAAAELPPGNGPIQPLLGVGDRNGTFTAVLAVLRGHQDSRRQLLERSAAPGASIVVFRSRTGLVAERIERRDGRLTVTTAHTFTAAGEPYRFLILGVAHREPEDALAVLRTVGTALSLSDDLATLRRSRLHG